MMLTGVKDGDRALTGDAKTSTVTTLPGFSPASIRLKTPTSSGYRM